MDNAARVEIVIPTRNRKEYLEEAVESVRQQTFRSWRLIIVDDSSTDGTAEYLTELNDEKITPLILEQQQERSRARNIGLRQCEGEFVLFLDDDDLLFPTAIEHHLQALEDCGEAVASIGGQLKFGRSASPQIRRLTRKRKSVCILDDLLFGHNFVCGQTLFRTAEIRRVGGWNPSVTFAEDYELWLRLAAESKVVLTPELVLRQRLHEGQWRPRDGFQVAAEMRAEAISRLEVRHRKRARQVVRAGDLARQAKRSFHEGRIVRAMAQMLASLGSAPTVVLSSQFRRELLPQRFDLFWAGLRTRLSR
jgi:glycosyltransferase involved in cell wall biosynthesis